MILVNLLKAPLRKNNMPLTNSVPVLSLKRKILIMRCPGYQNGIGFLILFLIIPFTGLQATGFSLQHQQQQLAPSDFSVHHQFHPSGYPAESAVTPYIESVKYNTTVFVGQTAYLPCVVKHLGDKTGLWNPELKSHNHSNKLGMVSWIRKKDLHILTSGSHIYTSDPRVSLLREGKLLNSWTLKLSSVQKKDLGQYECQVNTEPKMTITLYLIVLGSTDDEVQQGALALGMLDLPQHQRDSSLDTFSKGYEARILGPGHVQIHQGQTANLTCLVAHGGPSPNITWFLNDIPLLKTSNTRGGINIETERSPFATISKLVIVRADRRDEGKYSCGGITVYPDSVVLRVLPFHSRSEEESDEAVPMMVSVASSARVGAKPPFSSIHLDPSTIIITNRHHSFNKLLPTWTHFARQTTSIFFASFITYIFHYQAIHSLNAPAV